jgi:hypothetical protein
MRTWSRISAAEKMRDVLEQAKQKEKPVDKTSKNERTRSVSPRETNEPKLNQRGCAKSISTTLDTSSLSPPLKQVLKAKAAFTRSGTMRKLCHRH